MRVKRATFLNLWNYLLSHKQERAAFAPTIMFTMDKTCLQILILLRTVQNNNNN